MRSVPKLLSRAVFFVAVAGFIQRNAGFDNGYWFLCQSSEAVGKTSHIFLHEGGLGPRGRFSSRSPSRGFTPRTSSSRSSKLPYHRSGEKSPNL